MANAHHAICLDNCFTAGVAPHTLSVSRRTPASRVAAIGDRLELLEPGHPPGRATLDPQGREPCGPRLVLGWARRDAAPPRLGEHERVDRRVAALHQDA